MTPGERATILAFLAVAIYVYTRPRSVFRASDYSKDGKYHLLLCATGSVATIKLPDICRALARYENLSVRIVLSRSAARFLKGQSWEQSEWSGLKWIRNVDEIYVDRDEWKKPWVRGDPILHIELRRWADLMVIAPLSANSLAKLASGMSDNLVTSVARAWDTKGVIDGMRPGLTLRQNKKTIMVAPAMNTAMWQHPVTAQHLQKLGEEWSVDNGGWIQMLAPIEKGLACGDVGSGAMREWTEIVRKIETEFVGLRAKPETTWCTIQ